MPLMDVILGNAVTGGPSAQARGCLRASRHSISEYL